MSHRVVNPTVRQQTLSKLPTLSLLTEWQGSEFMFGKGQGWQLSKSLEITSSLFRFFWFMPKKTSRGWPRPASISLAGSPTDHSSREPDLNRSFVAVFVLGVCQGKPQAYKLKYLDRTEELTLLTFKACKVVSVNLMPSSMFLLNALYPSLIFSLISLLRHLAVLAYSSSELILRTPVNSWAPGKYWFITIMTAWPTLWWNWVLSSSSTEILTGLLILNRE